MNEPARRRGGHATPASSRAGPRSAAAPKRPAGRASVADRIPPQLYIVGSGLIQYVGAALAVVAFASVEPASVAWWRVVTGAVVLLAWKRPWRGGLTRSDLAISALFGVIVLTMNSSFYEAIARIPLGTAVSIEFIGPVAVAVIRGRGWRPRVAAVLAFAGVACIGGLVTNLALGCAWGSLFFAPILGPGAMAATTSWKLIAIVVGVGLLSTAIPYSFEAIAMRRLAASTFALFAAILPAMSALVGAVMLRQIPGVFELIGLVLVSVAVWLASRA